MKMRFSFRTKIVSAVCGIVVISALVDAVQMYRETAREKINSLNHFSVVAEQVSNGIAAQFYERYGDIQAFALNPVLQNPNNSAAISDLLNKYAALYGIYDVILYVDPNGKFIASNTLNPGGSN